MNKFNFFVNADIDEEIYKASKKTSNKDRYKNMIIYGLASTNDKDFQDEILEPSGYDIEDFLKSGLLNLEHFTTRKGDPSYWIGEPLEAKVEGNKFFVKGKLWETHPLARNFWDTLLIMKESGSKRRPGWSIEGKAIERDPINPKHITKAKISHAALTFSPINSNSWVDIAKGQQTEDYIDTHDNNTVSGGEYILQFEKDGNIITINPDFSVDIKPKAITTETIRPLSKEDLEKRTHNLQMVFKAYHQGLLKSYDVKKIIDLHK